MNDLDVQTRYWDSVATAKTFTHPVPLPLFHALLPATAKILDYGCGYGRTCAELADAGYHEVIGVDISTEMIKRGKNLYGQLDLRPFDGKSLKFNDGFFDACILMAVLTCIPSDAGQKQAIGEIYRLLRPGGIVFVSDYPIQTDGRNQKRYREFEKEFDVFGTFRLSDGAVVRHHDTKWIHQLLSDFDILSQKNIRVLTMNKNDADVFQIMARKRNSDEW